LVNITELDHKPGVLPSKKLVVLSETVKKIHRSSQFLPNVNRSRNWMANRFISAFQS